MMPKLVGVCTVEVEPGRAAAEGKPGVSPTYRNIGAALLAAAAAALLCPSQRPFCCICQPNPKLSTACFASWCSGRGGHAHDLPRRHHPLRALQQLRAQIPRQPVSHVQIPRQSVSCFCFKINRYNNLVCTSTFWNTGSSANIFKPYATV